MNSDLGRGHHPPARGPSPRDARGFTYQHRIIQNLEDLLGPAILMNPAINLACAYAELKKLFSMLAPHETAGDDLAEAITRAADDCRCREALDTLRRHAADSLRAGAPVSSIDRVREAVATAILFIQRLRTQSQVVPCACGARIAYRVAEILDVVPPARHVLTCHACGKRHEWFIPRP